MSERASGVSGAPEADRPAAILGLGPHGERPASPDRLRLGEAEAATARAAGFTVAVVLHTRQSDWARQHLAGIVATLGRFAVTVLEVVDCAFDAGAQVRALERLVRRRPDAIISLPVSNSGVAEAHRQVSAAGIHLILIDNSPSALRAGTDYACLVSADNFGLGQIGARLLAPCVPHEGMVGVVSYNLDFFVAAQREIAFRKWMADQRPDIRLHTVKFREMEQVGPMVGCCLDDHPGLAGLFVIWDTPAIAVLAELRARGRSLPVTTIDLGTEIAVALAQGDLVRGVGAQQPYDQGVTVATATVATLLGLEVPAWIALPALEVTRERVVSVYQSVWHAPAPETLIRAALG
ncbi:substrate-binding domain-containing protein [Labrys wisconsinensis]|uniref:Ribose transport system substrate-binding protein n=1 Tax=Labrys wisconsinensis TaxID=425677 RepID=A0ABU0JJ38_9HYPH|nr:substrate-binding domain-containing protein [Labrys wisconsinensis]MDQ0473147.1 ribose transport system substrate-binding protein [Labrys wisconsinensis]